MQTPYSSESIFVKEMIVNRHSSFMACVIGASVVMLAAVLCATLIVCNYLATIRPTPEEIEIVIPQQHYNSDDAQGKASAAFQVFSARLTALGFEYDCSNSGTTKHHFTIPKNENYYQILPKVEEALKEYEKQVK